jgi:hypothetical protein
VTIASNDEEEKKEYNIVDDDDAEFGYTGMPAEWEDTIRKNGFTKEDVKENPTHTTTQPNRSLKISIFKKILPTQPF